MSILKFNLSGKTAFFRSNEVNEGDLQFTFGHIHKIALMGILGAILGIDGHMMGYLKLKDKYVHPEFYTKLKDIKVSIVPKVSKGYFRRKKHNMVNTAGYANEAGKKAATLMYTEQWLEDVSWDIYIDLQYLTVNELREKLIDYILNGKSRFITYLGKTNHPATIKNVEILEKKKISNDKININSLFLSDKVVKVKNKGFGNSNLNEFIYKEVLPVAYTDNKSLYVSKSFTFSNAKFNIGNNEEFLEVNGLNLFFF